MGIAGMVIQAWLLLMAVVLASTFAMAYSDAIEGLGVNWGTMSSHPMGAKIGVNMLKANGIKKVKFFDVDEGTMSELRGTGIEVMLGIPNDRLKNMSYIDHAKKWVEQNVSSYPDVNIKYIAVGNEPFLLSYNGSFADSLLPALTNIQQALNDASLGHQIKTVVPFNADVCVSSSNNSVPSANNFRPDIQTQMSQIVKHLNSNNAPFIINIQPYIDLYQITNFPIDYAFFDSNPAPVNDNGTQYTNAFDAIYDGVLWSLKKEGVQDVKVIVGEIGWPTDGDQRATTTNAQMFYNGLLKKLAKKEGTPLRPETIEVYLSSLFDEDMRSITIGNFNRHWGLFLYDGKPKFTMDLSGTGDSSFPVGATGVEYLPKQWCITNDGMQESNPFIVGTLDYACAKADCSTLGYGSSCNGLTRKGNISYIFNSYFQTKDQDVRSCDFHGLAKITSVDPSEQNCQFPIQLLSRAERRRVMGSMVMAMVVMALSLIM